MIKRVVLGQTDEVSVQDNRINLFGPIRFTYQPPPQQSNISSSVSTVSHRKSASCTASTTIALETSTTDLEENVEGDVEKQPKCKLFTASNKAAGGVTDDFDKSKIVLSADQMIGLDMIELKDRTSFITDSIQDDLTNDVQTIVEDLIHDEEEIIV